MMDRNLKARWVAALRSGKYRQGYGTLAQRGNKRTKYCCIGVLCKIQGAKFVRVPGQDPGPDLYLVTERGPKIFNMFPPVYAKGISPHALHYLANMNDSRNFPFRKIADYIEKTL